MVTRRRRGKEINKAKVVKNPLEQTRRLQRDREERKRKRKEEESRDEKGKYE